jgi:hypothetical protein
MAHIKEEERERFTLTSQRSNVIMLREEDFNKQIIELLEQKAEIDRKIYLLARKRDGLKSNK